MSRGQEAVDVGVQQSLLEELIEAKPTLEIPQYDNKPLLTHNGNSIRTTIMPEAWQDAGIDIAEPGDAQQYYFPDEQILVIDLMQDREQT